MKVITVRIDEPLKAIAEQTAEDVGISLNRLCLEAIAGYCEAVQEANEKTELATETTGAIA